MCTVPAPCPCSVTGWTGWAAKDTWDLVEVLKFGQRCRKVLRRTKLKLAYFIVLPWVNLPGAFGRLRKEGVVVPALHSRTFEMRPKLTCVCVAGGWASDPGRVMGGRGSAARG